MHPDAEVRLPLEDDVDVVATLLPLRQGRLDPTWHVAPDEVAHALVTPEGPATVALRPRPGEALARLWGPGTAYLLPRLPDLLGVRDDPSGFRPRHPRVADLQRRHGQGLRLALHPTPIEAVIAVILQQRVAWKDACRSWRLLCHAYGSPAPGPLPLHTPPDPTRLATVGYADLHPLAIEQRRAVAIREACRRRGGLDRLRGLPGEDVEARLRSMPGVGPWTSAMVAGKAYGHADALPTDDVNLPHAVAWVLAGVARSDDATMIELLEPFRPHRWRVVQLLLASAEGAPRRGPRISGRWAPGA